MSSSLGQNRKQCSVCTARRPWARLSLEHHLDLFLESFMDELTSWGTNLNSPLSLKYFISSVLESISLAYFQIFPVFYTSFYLKLLFFSFQEFLLPHCSFISYHWNMFLLFFFLCVLYMFNAKDKS